MPGWFGGLGRDRGLAVHDDAVADLVNVQPQPLGGAGAFAIVGGTVAVNPTGLEEAIVLLELHLLVGVVDGVSAATAALDHGKTRHIAGPIRDVVHVLNGDAAILSRHL